VAGFLAWRSFMVEAVVIVRTPTLVRTASVVPN
jgi:hypothetical protein